VPGHRSGLGRRAGNWRIIKFVGDPSLSVSLLCATVIGKPFKSSNSQHFPSEGLVVLLVVVEIGLSVWTGGGAVAPQADVLQVGYGEEEL
jgi:hypothetical protein